MRTGSFWPCAGARETRSSTCGYVVRTAVGDCLGGLHTGFVKPPPIRTHIQTVSILGIAYWGSLCYIGCMKDERRIA